MWTDRQIDNLIAAQFIEWELSHGPLFDIGLGAARNGDHDTFDLVQLLLKDLPPDDEDD